MTCHEWAAGIRRNYTDLTFKVGEKSIVILKDLPVVQCDNCSEYLIEDEVILSMTDAKAELEIISFPASPCI